MRKLIVPTIALIVGVVAGLGIGRSMPPTAAEERSISHRAIQSFIAASRDRTRMENAVKATRPAGWKPVDPAEDLNRRQRAIQAPQAN